MPEQDMLSLGVMGMGAGVEVEEILPSSSPSPPPSSAPQKSRVFGEIGSLRFVTHSGAMNFLASAYESYGRGGPFLSS